MKLKCGVVEVRGKRRKEEKKMSWKKYERGKRD